MIMKQITLAAFAALFITANMGNAHAEGGISSAVSDEGSSAALEADYAATHGNVVVTARSPSAGMQSYGYSRANGIDQKSRQDESVMHREHD